MHSSHMSIESWLSVESFLAALHGTLESLRLAVDGLYVHQEVVAHTEPSSTLLALGGERERGRGERERGREGERQRGRGEREREKGNREGERERIGEKKEIGSRVNI